MLQTSFFARSGPGPYSWVPSLIALSPIVPIVAMSFLGKQPKEVTVTVYSAYLAILFGVAAVFAKKKGKRGLVVIASATCIAFTAVFLVYVYLALER
jgi:hypothetical protein